mgnify:CR=1 FL=1
MSKRIEIVPAILTDDPSNILSMLNTAKSFTSLVQIDFMDGIFVPSTSIKTDLLLNHPPPISWEAHIMVARPETEIDNLVKAGASKVIFHYEATSNHTKIINSLHNAEVKAGIALNPETEIELLSPLLKILDSLLFMSVNPGFYGAPFIPAVLEKIENFKKLNCGVEIGIDGGIKDSNIATVAKSGVDYICVGSAIFLNNNPGKSYDNLLKLVNN